MTRKLVRTLRAYPMLIGGTAFGARSIHNMFRAQSKGWRWAKVFSVYGRNPLPPEIGVMWKAMELKDIAAALTGFRASYR